MAIGPIIWSLQCGASRVRGKETKMQNGFRNMAQRIENARANFVATIAERGAIDQATAARVASHYIALKVAKLDAVNGVYNVKHGAFLDADVIARAVKAVKAAP